MKHSIPRRRFIGTASAGLFAAATGFTGRSTAGTLTPFEPRESDADTDVFSAARRRFMFSADITYGNTGTLGACPRDVMDAYLGGLEKLERELPDWPYYQPDGEPLTGYQELHDFRARIGRFVNADAAEIALTQNATMGMSFVANGLEMNAGDEVLTTDQEHSGGIGGWRLRAARNGIVVRELPLRSALEGGPDAISDLFRRAITSRTRVLMVSHITSQFGIVMPVQDLCALAREHDILSVIDGAQAVGQIRVDVAALGCDVYVASPHKWLLAPKGTGFMSMRRDLPVRIWATLAGSHYEDWDDAFRFMQFGTGSLPIVHGLAAALDFIDRIGMERIERWNRMLNDRLRHGLREIAGVTIRSPGDAALAAAITTFRVDGSSARELQDALWKSRIRVRAQGDDNGVRVCSHLYVAPADIDRALAVVRSLA